jgi:hypothetical protein
VIVAEGMDVALDAAPMVETSEAKATVELPGEVERELENISPVYNV